MIAYWSVPENIFMHDKFRIYMKQHEQTHTWTLQELQIYIYIYVWSPPPWLWAYKSIYIYIHKSKDVLLNVKIYVSKIKSTKHQFKLVQKTYPQKLKNAPATSASQSHLSTAFAKRVQVL